LGDLVTHQFKQDPLSGNLFVFTNRRKNRIKLLYFDGTGVWVCAKRLMGQGCFAWPDTTEPGALRIAAEELTLLLTGLDLGKTKARTWWRPAG
jgi:transposase